MPTSTGTYDQATLTYNQSNLSFDGFDVPLANMPAVGVFIAWTDGPYVAAPAWTEISQYVRGVTIRRGRSDDLQQFPPGAAQVVLDNRLRYFDPFNTSAPAPFNGNLKPRKQIKIVANWSGVEYPLFRGFVAGWPVEYTDGGLDSTVTIDCFDIIGLIGADTINRNVVEEYTLSLNPRNFFPMSESPAQNRWPCRVDPRFYFGESGTAIVPGPGGSGGSIPWRETSFQQSAPLKPAIKSMAIGCESNFIPLQIGTPNGDWPPATAFPAGNFSVSIVIDVVDKSGATSYFDLVFSRFGGSPYPVRVGSNGLAVAQTVTGSTTTRDDMRNRKGTHIVVTYNATTNLYTMYLDGDLGSTGTASGSPVGIFPLTGDVSISGSSQWVYLNNGTKFQHLALWDRILTQAEARNLSQALLGQIQMTTAERAAYYLSSTPLPSAMFNISTDMTSDVSEIETEPTPIMNALRGLVASEGGEMFVDNKGILQFYSKNDVFNKTRSNTSQMTFTDTGTGIYYDYQQLRMHFSADNILNQITVTGTSDIETAVTDSASVAAYGQAAVVVDTQLLDSVETQTLADRLLTIYKNPKMAVEPFMSKGQQDPAYNWPRLLGLELLDRVTFKRTPATGSAVVKDLLVQSIEHRFTPGTWETVVNGSARYTNWFIVGVSLIGGDDLLLN